MPAAPQAPVASGPADPEPTLAQRLVARRLPVTLWLDPSGVVLRAEVSANEVAEDVALQLGQALVGMRVAGERPAGEQDAPMVSRLCFDDEGRMESPGAECLAVEDAPAR